MSASGFSDRNLLEDVGQALDRTGLAPADLELEITESKAMEPSQRLLFFSGQPPQGSRPPKIVPRSLRTLLENSVIAVVADHDVAVC